jgi:ribosomal protein S12 methylthiotransferase accessory factor
LTLKTAFVPIRDLADQDPSYSRLVQETGHFLLPGDCPIHVAAAVLRPDRFGRRRIVSGRGRTPEEALRSTLAEAAERASAVVRGDEPTLWSSFASIRRSAVDPRALTLFSERQYRYRVAWNRAVGPAHRIPRPFDPEADIEWIVAETADGGERFVPAAHCLLGYPQASECGLAPADSSGCAAGESRDAAVVAGFLELVERDAAAIWWYGCLRRPAMRVVQPSASFVDAFANWFGRLGRNLRLLDLTHDFAVPVVAAIGADGQGSDLSFGLAAAATPARAIESALGELIQFEITAGLRGSAGRRAPRNDWVDWCRTASIDEHPHLSPSNEASVIHRSEPLSVETCVALCHARGLALLAVNLTRAEIHTPVVKLVVPGLRPLWPRFAPGRLFDVPVQAGWRQRPVSESRLNPVPILY